MAPPTDSHKTVKILAVASSPTSLFVHLACILNKWKWTSLVSILHKKVLKTPRVNNKCSEEYKYLVNNRDGWTTKFWRPHSSISSRLLFCVSMCLNAVKIVKYNIITTVLPQHVSPFPRNYCDLRPYPHGVTVRPVPIPAVLPWDLSPSPRCYREVCPHPHRGVSMVTAVLPWSPSPCSSLLCWPR